MLPVHLSIWVLRRLQLLAFAVGLTDASTLLLLLIPVIIFLVVVDPFHTIGAVTISILVIPSKARPPSSTATGTLVMSRQCVTARKLSAALIALVRSLSSM